MLGDESVHELTKSLCAGYAGDRLPFDAPRWASGPGELTFTCGMERSQICSQAMHKWREALTTCPRATPLRADTCRSARFFMLKRAQAHLQGGAT